MRRTGLYGTGYRKLGSQVIQMSPLRNSLDPILKLVKSRNTVQIVTRNLDTE